MKDELKFYKDMNILACFFPECQMSIKDIQERSGYSYERVSTFMKRLQKDKSVNKIKKGNKFLFSLNIKSLKVLTSYNIFAINKLKFFEKNNNLTYNILQELKETLYQNFIPFSFIGFNQNPDSLFIISDSKKVNAVLMNLKRKYNLDFKIKINTKINLKDIIILDGIDYYYKLNYLN
jgi:predicted transcriptional regulator